MTGDGTDIVMAGCVSTSVAVGVGHVLTAALPPGLHRAAIDTEEVSRWLDELA